MPMCFSQKSSEKQKIESVESILTAIGDNEL